MHGTQVHGARVPFKTPLEKNQHVVIGMEFELHELEFHAKKKISKFDRA